MTAAVCRCMGASGVRRAVEGAEQSMQQQVQGVHHCMQGLHHTFRDVSASLQSLQASLQDRIPAGQAQAKVRIPVKLYTSPSDSC